MQVRKTLLFHEGVPWVKRSDNEDFDVPMCSYDSAEVCDLVGAFLLNNLSHVIDETSVGLYRDDGLGVFKDHSGSETERKGKENIKTYSSFNLSITIEINIRVNPNDNPMHINKNSNHPPTVLRQIAKSVTRGISETFSNEQIFKESIPIYKEALKTSEFHEKLEYVREEVNKHGKEKKKRRKRKIIWFNLSFSNNVKSNVGKQLLR